MTILGADRQSKILDAVNKVASADPGAFCNIVENKEGKVMVAVENAGGSDEVIIKVQGDLSDDQVSNILSVVESLGGDTLQMEISTPKDNAVNIIEQIFKSALNTDDYDVEIELVLE